jgi:NAD(P)-dependent dehydrogenase (short-subunit alcohol dehydrogenase family)
MTIDQGVRFDFSHRSALVTGGSNGIGAAIARAFRDAGASVTITGTREADDYRGDLAGMTYRRLEVRDGIAVKALAAGMPKLDVLVNCAGTARPDGRNEYELEAFAAALDINLVGSMRLCDAFLPQLTAAKGAIVNIASMTSYAASPRVPGYGASKAGVLQLTKTLAAAWARHGIRVNAVAPGWIETKLTEALVRTPELSKPIIDRTPMGRWGKPDEIAGCVLFLASPAAGFVTGVTVPVDGGYSAT